jgi:hypothetical protein
MIVKRAISYAIVLFFLFTLAAVIVLASFSFLLPRLLETRIISDIESETGIADFLFQVRELDLAGADFGDVRVGSESEPALIVRSIQIDYSAAGLLKKKIKKVTASGVELYCEFKDGKFGFRGIDLESLIQRLQSRMGDRTDSSDTDALLALERLVLHNAVIIFDINSAIYRIPGEIEILPENAAFNQITFTANIYLRGQKLALTAGIDLNKKTISVAYAAKNINLAKFADLTQLIEGLSLSGEATIEGTTNLKWEPFAISSHVSSIELYNTKIGINEVQLQNPSGPDKTRLPLRIQLQGAPEAEWKLKVSAIAGIAPIGFTLSEIDSRFMLTKQEVKCTGKFKLTPATIGIKQKKSLPIQITEYVPLWINYSTHYSDSRNWSFDLTNQIAKQEASKFNRFKFNNVDVTAKTPLVKISGSVINGKGKTTYRINIPQVNVTSDMARITLPAVTANGSATIHRNQNGTRAITFNLQLPGSRISLDTAEIKIPRVTLSGKSIHGKEKMPRIEAHLRWDDGSMSIPEYNARVTGIKGAFPLQWPLITDAQSGSFSVGRLQFKKMNIGAVRGTIRQTSQGITFQGRHLNGIIPKLTLMFSGGTEVFGTQNPATNVHFQLAPAHAAIDTDVGKFLPQATGVLIGGNLSMEGDLVFDKKGLRGTLNANLKKGALRIPEQKVSIEGISMGLSMPDLPDIRSAPQQQLFFDKVTASGIEFSDGRMEFQIESLKSLFIEKTQFIWSEGNVDVYALRISPGVEDYRLILYCDRLNMAKVLEQFGAATAVGEGRVSGRIPLRYNNGMISFDDGFLFSTPGETGKIRVTDTEILTAGIAPDTPQYVQMELAREALKDYDVSWAKLNITSEGEDVLLRMQLDGKPAKILPFVYKKELGGFAKIEAKGKGSKFQGIRLDVNFRLPLNQLLQYKGLIEMIQ